MGLILYANFFAYLIVAVNHADAAAVGEACSAANDCTGDILCDEIHDKCLIKEGASCASPNADKCVSHATCTSGTCRCNAEYTTNAAKLCEANIGTACNTSVACIATSVCDNVFEKCLVKHGESCASPNADKCVSHATCTSGLCGCNTEYSHNAAGICEAKVGTACNTSVACIATSVCDNVFKKCLVKHGESCASPNADNCVSNAKCTNNVCGCDTGYTFNTDGLCEANIGTACNTSVGCIATSVCDNVFGKCLVKHGESCANPNADNCVSNAKCTSNVCGCDTGYTFNTDGLCKANLGTACNASVSCVPSYVCDNVSRKCLIKAGGSCASNIDKCVSNATCSEAGSTCGCNNGYSANDEGLCVLQTNNTGKTLGISLSALVTMLLSGMCFTFLMM